MLKDICLITFLLSLAPVAAQATPAGSSFANATQSDVDIYGVVINTDGGTFDGVELVKAVLASTDLILSPPHSRPQAARAQQGLR